MCPSCPHIWAYSVFDLYSRLGLFSFIFKASMSALIAIHLTLWATLFVPVPYMSTMKPVFAHILMFSSLTPHWEVRYSFIFFCVSNSKNPPSASWWISCLSFIAYASLFFNWAKSSLALIRILFPTSCLVEVESFTPLFWLLFEVSTVLVLGSSERTFSTFGVLLILVGCLRLEFKASFVYTVDGLIGDF